MDDVLQNDLEVWFGDYNSRFFKGQISKWTVQLGFPPDLYDVGIPDGYCDQAGHTLSIGFGNQEKARKTLICKMIHASAGDWHWKQFRKELNCVKELGAPVFSSDLNPLTVPTGNDIRELIIEFIRHGLKFHEVQEETGYVLDLRAGRL